MEDAYRTSKREWFRSWFNDQYIQVYSHRNNSEAAEFVSVWPFWDTVNRNGWCLDLGCGNGRYSAEIASHGMKVIGLDLSQALLTHARESDSAREVHLIRADFRNIPIKPGFDLIVSLFTSFGYFNDEENEELLGDVAKLLKTDGIFVLDVINPVFAKINVRKNRETQRVSGELTITEKRRIDSKQKRVVKDISVTKDGITNNYRESVRLYDASELTAMLSQVGIRSYVTMWGDYQGTEFSEEAPRIVFFGVKCD